MKLEIYTIGTIVCISQIDTLLLFITYSAKTFSTCVSVTET